MIFHISLSIQKRFPLPSEENQDISETNYCPIHGLKRHGKRREEKNNQGVNQKDADNYRLNDSQKFTRQ